MCERAAELGRGYGPIGMGPTPARSWSKMPPPVRPWSPSEEPKGFEVEPPPPNGVLKRLWPAEDWLTPPPADPRLLPIGGSSSPSRLEGSKREPSPCWLDSLRDVGCEGGKDEGG